MRRACLAAAALALGLAACGGDDAKLVAQATETPAVTAAATGTPATTGTPAATGTAAATGTPAATRTATASETPAEQRPTRTPSPRTTATASPSPLPSVDSDGKPTPTPDKKAIAKKTPAPTATPISEEELKRQSTPTPTPTSTPAPAEKDPLACLTQAQLKDPKENSPSLWSASTGAETDLVAVDGPYESPRDAQLAVQSLGSFSDAEVGGNYVVSASASINAKATVSKVADCLDARDS